MEAKGSSFRRVQQAIDIIRQGGMVIMVDDEDRENEGDLVFAAEHVDAEKINFMAKEARGLICLTLEPEMVDRLGLPLMRGQSQIQDDERSTAFTVSIEAKLGVTTGISAHDRAQTVRVAVDERSSSADIVVPGHIFPLRAKPGGVLERAGHTEGSVDLARLAGCKSAGVICEIMRDDGSMARRPDLDVFAEKHGIPIVSIADLIHFRLLNDSLIEVIAEQNVRTWAGDFQGYLIKSLVDQRQHFALAKLPPKADLSEKVVDVRVQREKPLLDTLYGKQHSGERLSYGLNMLARSEAGVLIYLAKENPEGFALQDFQRLSGDYEPEASVSHKQAGTRPAQRVYGVGAQILRHLGVQTMRLHSNVELSLKALSGFGLEIQDIVWHNADG